MWTEVQVYREDLESIAANDSIEWTRFQDKTVFITGATGLIGQSIVGVLIYACAKHDISVKVLALVRSLDKAKSIFGELLKEHQNLKFVVGDVRELPRVEDEVDFIIHGASVTASASFVNAPVETVKTTLNGTIGVLELAEEKCVESMVYLSSMEVYGAGTSEKGQLLSEHTLLPIDPLNVRNCYPIGKLMSENLCVCYSSENDVQVKIARLAQTFGPGIDSSDRRVFFEFVRSVQNKEDIILKTDGLSTRMYVYTMDAVAALLTILLKGDNATAYNIANKDTYCSIKEMAQLVIDSLGQGEDLKAIVKKPPGVSLYPPSHHLYLDTAKIESLGWKPFVDLPEMYRRMVSAI